MPHFGVLCFRETVERVDPLEPLVPPDLPVPLDLLDPLERTVTVETL